MATTTYLGSLKEETVAVYHRLFGRNWPLMVSGAVIAIIALLIFLWSGPWGISAGYRNWGDWVFYAIGISDIKPELPWLHTVSVTNVGLLAGALASALISGQFAVRFTSKREYGKAILGGVLMGIGASLSKGCNVGGFFSAVGVFSMGGYAMMAGLGVGAYLGLRVLLWELNRFAPATASPQAAAGSASSANRDRLKRIAGGMMIAASIGVFCIYSAVGKTTIGGLMFFGFLIGITMHRSRFCFVRAFRDPLMTGEADMVKVVAFSLAIYGAGSAVIKWNYLQPDVMGVHHPFVLGSFFGGALFGIGMLLAGGCASSTLWRTGEGHTKLFVTLVTFALTNSTALRLISKYGLEDAFGSGVFLPGVVSWYLTIPVFMGVLLLWVATAVWNEKTEKYVVF